MSATLLSPRVQDQRPALPLWRAISLHLLPGILIGLLYTLVAPFFVRANVPPVAAIYIAIAVVLVPFELGLLLLLGKRRNGRVSLEGIVLNREVSPPAQVLWLVPVLLIWAVAVFMVIGPSLDRMVAERLLFWLPDLFQPSAMNMTAAGLAGHSRAVLLAVWAAAVLLDGLVGPWVEELYFRGYLLPRMAVLGRWAPLLNIVLFSLYHFFTPWQNLTRILALLPLIYAVWWKRNIRISILTHCLLNTGSLLMLLPLILRAA